MQIPVIFRTDKAGEVTAFFPYEPGTNEFDVSCYAHIGQHSSASLDYYRETRPASETERAPLLAELSRLYLATGGDTLKVIQRFPADAFGVRRKAMAR